MAISVKYFVSVEYSIPNVSSVGHESGLLYFQASEDDAKNYIENKNRRPFRAINHFSSRRADFQIWQTKEAIVEVLDLCSDEDSALADASSDTESASTSEISKTVGENPVNMNVRPTIHQKGGHLPILRKRPTNVLIESSPYKATEFENASAIVFGEHRDHSIPFASSGTSVV